MPTFGRKLAPTTVVAFQNTVAGEELQEGWLVKLDPAEDGTVLIGTTAITDHPYGIVAAGTGDENGIVAAGTQFLCVSIGEAVVQVKDNETLDPGDRYSPSAVKGKAQKLLAASAGVGQVRGSASGTGQTILATIGVHGFQT
jgi:hypothetical protein